jgi:anti-sigma factor RsiW
MNCRATIRLICDYLEGRLSPSVESEVAQHIGHCSNCSKVLEAAEHTLEASFGMDASMFPHAHHHA